MPIRYNWRLARCFHRGAVKVLQIDEFTQRVICQQCLREIWRFTKYNDEVTSINEEIAKKMLVMGQVRDLTEFEREVLK